MAYVASIAPHDARLLLTRMQHVSNSAHHHQHRQNRRCLTSRDNRSRRVHDRRRYRALYAHAPLHITLPPRMKVHIKHWSAVAQWRWNTGSTDQDDEDVCGICRVPYEGCCPSCKMPGDDCPLSAFPPLPLGDTGADAPATVWGECSHVFHMHCLLKWLGTAASKQQCPMDRRPWGAFSPLLHVQARALTRTTVTAERKVSETDRADPDPSESDEAASAIAG